MKTRIILLVCLFISLANNTSVAQEKSNGATQGWIESAYWGPVYCDGVMVDLLEGGEISVHYVYRLFKTGNVVYKEIDQIKGTVTSQTGEVFTIRETDKLEFTDHWEVTWHYNLKGDQGTHYIGTLTMNYQTGEITIGNTVCK